MTKVSRKLVTVDSLLSSDAVNIRSEYNYDLPSMVEDIVRDGGITEPITVEALADGQFMTLKGNRRLRAARFIRANADKYPAALVKSLDKLDSIIHPVGSLTAEERIGIVYDHGSTKPLSFEDTVRGVWNLCDMLWPERRIIAQMYHAIADFLGSRDKLPAIANLATVDEREKALVSTFHASVGGFLMKIHELGDYCRAQYLNLQKDRDGHKGIVVEVKMTRPRVNELLKAKKADGDSWTHDKGGSEFNRLLSQFKGEDNGVRQPSSRPTVAVIEKALQNGVYRSPLTRTALAVSIGQQDKGADLLRLDALAVRYDHATDAIRRNVNAVKDDAVRAFFVALLSDSPLADVENTLAALLNGPVVRKDNTPSIPEPDESGEAARMAS